ncbi:uncharacterized protein LOC142173792 [Nicotiana tabacum]|uniref:Uncharacterized protein LOC142173792 n=1 Tax=Nicotiana tabacum TaxID=4097 RepID=A0AC58TE90_TOBAC
MAFSLSMDDCMLRYQGRLCIPNVDGLWGKIMIEAQTSGYHDSIQMVSLEALYGRRCRSPFGWFKIGKAELIGPELVHQAMEKVKIIKEWLKTSQSRQKSYRDIRRRELVFQDRCYFHVVLHRCVLVMLLGLVLGFSSRWIGQITGETLAKVLEIQGVRKEFGTAVVRSNSGAHIGC